MTIDKTGKFKMNDSSAIDSFAKLTTDAGTMAYNIIKFDVTNGALSIYDSGVGGNWKTVKTLVDGVYEVCGLSFDLLHSPTAGKDFNTLGAGGKKIDFYITRSINGNDTLVGAGKQYTQGAVASSPYASIDSGNPVVDDFYASGIVKVWVKTDAVMTALELPLRFMIARRG